MVYLEANNPAHIPAMFGLPLYTSFWAETMQYFERKQCEVTIVSVSDVEKDVK